MIKGQHNITKKDMIIRIIGGLFILGMGMLWKNSIENFSGIFLLSSGLIEWCPFYSLFGMIRKKIITAEVIYEKKKYKNRVRMSNEYSVN